MSSAYFADIERFPLLTRDEERELARKGARGDLAARGRMVESNLRLVIAIAKRFQGRGLDLDDLIAEGNFGLLRAVEDFDPERDLRFCTYAYHWIASAIRRSIADRGSTIRLPTWIFDLANRVRIDPAHEDTLDAGQKANLRLARRAISVHHANFDAAEPEAESDDAARVRDADAIEHLFLCLSPLERAVVAGYYGLGGHESALGRDVADSLGKTSERIAGIAYRARTKMKRMAADEDRERWGNDHVS